MVPSFILCCYKLGEETRGDDTDPLVCRYAYFALQVELPIHVCLCPLILPTHSPPWIFHAPPPPSFPCRHSVTHHNTYDVDADNGSYKLLLISEHASYTPRFIHALFLAVSNRFRLEPRTINQATTSSTRRVVSFGAASVAKG